MRNLSRLLVPVALPLMVAVAYAQSSHHAIGMNARSIKGFPTGEISLTGGGAFEVASGFAKLGGSFSCLRDVNQGPLAGLRAGEGVRWDTDSVLTRTSFKCSGAASEPLKPATSDDNTIVIKADFYRAGDGTHESFQANMIISRFDLDPDQPGVQNVWVQGVGCGEAQVNFN